MILGDSFMRQVVVVYDKEKQQMGFKGSDVTALTLAKSFLPLVIIYTVQIGMVLIILLSLIYRLNKLYD